MTSCSQKNVVYFYFLLVEHPPFDEDSEITGSSVPKSQTCLVSDELFLFSQQNEMPNILRTDNMISFYL